MNARLTTTTTTITITTTTTTTTTTTFFVPDICKEKKKEKDLLRINYLRYKLHKIAHGGGGEVTRFGSLNSLIII